MPKIVDINVGEMAVGEADACIRTNGVGSCMVICIRDEHKKVGGMAHSMLPTRNKSSKIRKELVVIDNYTSVGKYVDEAIERLVEEIEYLGGKKERMIAKLVGGSRMFKFLNDSDGGIGSQNIEMAKKKLAELQIPIDGEDVGGTVGRMAEFNVGNGVVAISIRI